MVTLDFLDQRQSTMNNKGQSTIEFLSSFTLAFSLIFFFVKMAMNFTESYMVQYATYMSSRVYLVHDNTSSEISSVENQAFNAAKAEFEKYSLDKIIPDFDGRIDVNPTTSNAVNAYVGIFSTYTTVSSMAKLVGGREPMVMKTESFLGKEVTRGECANRVCDAIKAIGGVSCKEQVTLFDNGC